MLSLPLAAALFDALRPKCQLVLVGDVDQLPPVGERGRELSCTCRLCRGQGQRERSVGIAGTRHRCLA